MTIGARSNRDELVKTLRGMQFSKLDLSFITGEYPGQETMKGYDRHGKYGVRVWRGIGLAFVSLVPVLVLASFGQDNPQDFDDPVLTWIRANVGWIFLTWSIVSVVLWISGRKIYRAKVKRLEEACEKNGLALLPFNYKIPGGLVNPKNRGPIYRASFTLKYELEPKVAFGLTHQWWDSSSKPLIENGWNQFLHLFVYVSLPELDSPTIYLNPKTPPVWSELPPMSDEAKAVVTNLASRYSVVIGGGFLGIGYARGTSNSFGTSLDALEGTMNIPIQWKVCYGLLSTEVADIIEGLE
jgi:hypothetical protein